MKRLLLPRWCIFVFVLLSPGARLVAANPPTPVAVASVDELRSRITAHVSQPRFASALWGVKIASLASGRTVFEHHADRLMSPASNSKLYTGALALDQLGRDYRIVTPILASTKPDAAGELHGDLVISGRGDPSWKARGTKNDFWAAFTPVVDASAAAGVRHVTGDLVADATFFHSLPNGAGWTADDLNDDYGAEISAVTLEDNYAEVRLAPGQRVGEPITVSWLQPLAALQVDLRMTTMPKGAEKHVVAQRLFGETTVHLFGGLAIGSAPVVVEVTVPRPADWFARGLKEALAKRGIRVEGAARGVRWPEVSVASGNRVEIARVQSPPMRELVAAFMKPSQNLETDLIFGHIGELTRTNRTPEWKTTEELGVVALEGFLKKHGLRSAEVKFEEGSGLSRNNLTTANATVAVLTMMKKHAARDDFVGALPIAGVDGTLRRRMKGTAAEGNARAKTGSLRYANTISGYVTTAVGEELVFSVMLNRNSGQPANRNVREELDDIVVMLAGLTGRSEAR